MAEDERLRVVGGYALGPQIGAGGMATVHVGRLLGAEGFSRTIAIKCLRPELARDPELRLMFIEEARLASRIRHPNVAAMLDVVATDDEIFLVLDYVEGESLGRLIRETRAAGERIPPEIIVGILSDVLHGLHAAHEARDTKDELLRIVHRDVSPQNIVVGIDGVARVLDFGIAKAATSVAATRCGQVKGKAGYLAPEQLSGRGATPATDIFAAGIVLWEALTGVRLFSGKSNGELVDSVLSCRVEPPSARATGISRALDAVVLRALAREPTARFPTAMEMERALRACGPIAPKPVIGAWVAEVAAEGLAERRAAVATAERAPLDASTTLLARSAVSPVARVVRSRVSWILAAVVLTVAILVGVQRVADRRSMSSTREVPSAPVEEQPIEPSGERAPARAASSSDAPPSHTGPLPRAGAHPRRPRPPQTSSSCDPPFRVDPNGQRHFKAECL